MTEQHAPTDRAGQSPTEAVASHTDVIAVPGSPPWFSCQECGAFRSTHAGLADLPCEPDRYDQVDPAARVTAGERYRARVDQVLRDAPDRLVLAHTATTGVRIELETRRADVVRGDEIEVRIDALADGVTATVVQRVSTEHRVEPPTIVHTGGET